MPVKGVEFSSVDLQVIMEVMFLQKKTKGDIHECMLQTLTDKHPS